MPLLTTTPRPVPISQVLESCLCAPDLQAAERFYTQVLGLPLYSRQEGRHVFFRCGNRMVLLFNPAESAKGDPRVPSHGTSGAGHLCFAMRETDLPAWKEHLERSGVPIESDFTWPGGGRSLYFRDPAGNSLELATPRIWGIGEETLADQRGIPPAGT